jgi:hypothetical protein
MVVAQQVADLCPAVYGRVGFNFAVQQRYFVSSEKVLVEEINKNEIGRSSKNILRSGFYLISRSKHLPKD